MKCPICNSQNAARCENPSGQYCEDCDKFYSSDYMLGFYAGIGKATELFPRYALKQENKDVQT